MAAPLVKQDPGKGPYFRELLGFRVLGFRVLGFRVFGFRVWGFRV